MCKSSSPDPRAQVSGWYGFLTVEAGRRHRSTRRWIFAALTAFVLSALAVSARSLLPEQGSPNARWFVESTTLVFVITGACVASTQLMLVIDQMRDRETKDRSDGALWYSLNEHPDVRRAYQALDRKWDPSRYSGRNPVPRDEIRALLRREQQLERVFAHWERMARSLFAGIVDERMAFEAFGSHLVRLYERYRLFVETVEPGENPRAYRYLKALYPVWEERVRQEQNAGPFYLRHPPTWYAESVKTPGREPRLDAGAGDAPPEPISTGGIQEGGSSGTPESDSGRSGAP